MGGTRTIRSLPINPSIRTGAELKSSWEFNALVGHGSLYFGKFTTIPDNTYVIFGSPAGCRALFKSGIQFEDLLILRDDYNENDFYDAMLKEIRKPIGFLKTFTSTTGSEAYTHLTPTAASSICNASYDVRCSAISEAQASRAIYTPGTPVHDMILSFENKRGLKGLVLGFYQLPISEELGHRLSDDFSKLRDDRDVKYFDETIFKKDAVKHGNLLPGVIGNEYTLSNLFKRLPPIAPGKKRLLFIPACRGLEEYTEIRPQYTALARAASIGMRENAPENIVETGKAARERIETIPILKKTGLLDPSSLTAKNIPGGNINYAKLHSRIYNSKISNDPLNARRLALALASKKGNNYIIDMLTKPTNID